MLSPATESHSAAGVVAPSAVTVRCAPAISAPATSTLETVTLCVSAASLISMALESFLTLSVTVFPLSVTVIPE